MSTECRGFLHPWRPRRRDSTGWLGWQDSNLGMAEPRSAQGCDPQVCRTGSIPRQAPELIGGAPVQRADLSVPFCLGFDVAGGFGEGRSEVFVARRADPDPL